MTIQRVANFRVMHLHSDIKQTRRGKNINSITILTAYINTPIPFFSEKHSKKTGLWGQNSDILIHTQIAIFEISIFFETEKSA